MNSCVRHILICLFLAPLAFAQSDSTANVLPLYVKVQLQSAVKLSSVKPGDTLEGDLARDVYSPDRKLFPAGSHIRLTVDQLERRRRQPSNRWPWVIKVFTPRHENFPVFKEATILDPAGAQSLLHVSLLSSDPRIEIHAQAGHKKNKKYDAANPGATVPAGDSGNKHAQSQAYAPRIMSLEAQTEQPESATPADPSWATSAIPSTLAAGTTCRILLLQSVSASKSHSGDAIHARLLEPLLVDSRVVLPAGTSVLGTVLKVTPPKMLSRAGSLSISFTEVELPGGIHVPLSASLSEVELNRGSHTKLDPEGQLRGERPGVMWMLIDGGVTAGIAKEVDDGTQLVMEAILSGATDASTAGTARIAGTIASGIFMLTRHGRDVLLPAHTEMSIVLNRPVTIEPKPGSTP
ncbi:MAG TPA: hypothetical protein VKV39_18435 [Candidatus Sulfotelmatobacter sp.]|nr:hypothetical protein [Candidatus Sulfotelmatobacter sp.]